MQHHKATVQVTVWSPMSSDMADRQAFRRRVEALSRPQEAPVTVSMATRPSSKARRVVNRSPHGNKTHRDVFECGFSKRVLRFTGPHRQVMALLGTPEGQSRGRRGKRVRTTS